MAATTELDAHAAVRVDAARPFVPGSVRSFHREWMRRFAKCCGTVARDSEVEAQRPEPLYSRTMRALRGGRGTGQEIAACTSSATFFSTTGFHVLIAYDTGHRSPSSRLAASWKPRVEYR
jgi:hypothetical protein